MTNYSEVPPPPLLRGNVMPHRGSQRNLQEISIEKKNPMSTEPSVLLYTIQNATELKTNRKKKKILIESNTQTVTTSKQASS